MEMQETLNKLPDYERYIAGKLIEELLFIQKLMAELKSAIREIGVVTIAENGTVKESPPVKSYTQLVTRYGNLYNQLEKLISANVSGDGENALQAWLGKAK